MTKYGLIREDDEESDVPVTVNIVGHQEWTRNSTLSRKLRNKMNKVRRHSVDEDEERVALCEGATCISSSSSSPKVHLNAKHPKIRGIWKSMVTAVVQQFYYMNASIENSGGLYRATTVTRSDGTIGTELHYCPAPTLITCKS